MPTTPLPLLKKKKKISLNSRKPGFRRVSLGLTGFLIGLIVISDCRNFFLVEFGDAGFGRKKRRKEGLG
jgi:hypothetical protein